MRFPSHYAKFVFNITNQEFNKRYQKGIWALRKYDTRDLHRFEPFYLAKIRFQNGWYFTKHLKFHMTHQNIDDPKSISCSLHDPFYDSMLPFSFDVPFNIRCFFIRKLPDILRRCFLPKKSMCYLTSHQPQMCGVGCKKSSGQPCY